MSNAPRAIDASGSTFATMNMGLSVAGWYRFCIKFPAAAPEGARFTLVLANGAGLLDLGLLGAGVGVDMRHNGSSTGQGTGSGNLLHLSLLPCTCNTYSTLQWYACCGADEVCITLNGGLLGVGMNLRVYDAYYEQDVVLDLGSGSGNYVGPVLDPLAAVYPNPFQHTLQVNVTRDDSYALELYDLDGRICHYEQMSASTQNMNLQDLKPGLYMLRVIGSQGAETHKVVKLD
ncbi:MAG: T9SS type A sorting domain-containing protein [Bacteroidetes bacterium]|nr:T9SS type A sorting domain-containing protein [Bacteroidota bacterium]